MSKLSGENTNVCQSNSLFFVEKMKETFESKNWIAPARAKRKDGDPESIAFKNGMMPGRWKQIDREHQSNR